MNNLPFRPNLSRPDQTLARAAFAVTLARRGHKTTEQIAERLWPNDAIVKAAVSPATTTTPAWAGAVAQASVGDYVSSLSAASAASKVFADAVRVNLSGVASVTLPRRATPPAATDVTWVAEGSPFTVERLAVTGGAVLTPRKLGALIAITNELMNSSNAEAIFTEMLKESISFALDASFFSNVAASASRPAGILNGITATTATAGGGEAAQLGDLEKLAAAIADGVDDMVIVAHPRQAFALRLRNRGQLDFPVYSSRGVPAGTIVALDPKAVAVGFGAEPKFETSDETVIHMDDENPLPLAEGGTVASPARSMYQVDCTALRARLPVAWGLRSPGAVAWISGATWG